METRRIEFKTPSADFHYGHVCIMIVGAPEAGKVMNYAELCKRGDLADELEAAKDAAWLAEPHYQLLMRLVRGFNWSMVTSNGNLSKPLLDTVRMFVTDLENAPLVQASEAVKANG